MRISRLPAAFGVEIDLDLTRAPSEDEAAQLRATLDEHGLILLRGRTLSGPDQCRATACFGRIMQTADGKPMELFVSNRRQSSAPDGELIFHYDYAYDVNPIDVISLYGEEIETGATPTLFASSNRVLNMLPPALVDELRDLTALHACFLDREAPAEARAAVGDDATPRGAPGWNHADWRCSHPLVRTNRNGVETLFACVQHTLRILDLPIAESDALLARLFDRLYAPDNVYRHDWREGDLVIWDNLTVQHCRPTPAPAARTLRRYEVSDEDLTEAYLAVGRAAGFV